MFKLKKKTKIMEHATKLIPPANYISSAEILTIKIHLKENELAAYASLFGRTNSEMTKKNFV